MSTGEWKGGRRGETAGGRVGKGEEGKKIKGGYITRKGKDWMLRDEEDVKRREKGKGC